MDLKKISFCQKDSYNICSNNYKLELLNNLKDKYDIIYSERSIRLYDKYKHFNLINKLPYLMSIKSIGNSYLLYLTRINNINTCFLIDKKILKGYNYPRIILVKYRFSDQYFNDTIFEVDLIKCPNNWKLVISDIWILQGHDIKSINLIKRLEKIKKILESAYIPDKHLEPCSISSKKYYNMNYNDGQAIIQDISNLDYKIQGITFSNIYKFKPSILVLSDKLPSDNISKKRQIAKRIRNNKTFVPHIILNNDEHSLNNHIDKQLFNLKITKTLTPGIYQLFCSKIGKIIKLSIARINGLECLTFVRKILENDKDDIIVKCEYDWEFKKFIPKILSDKSVPDEYTDIIFHTNEKMV